MNVDGFRTFVNQIIDLPFYVVVILIPVLVPELRSAFLLGSAAFQTKYGFPKPKGAQTNVVITSGPGFGSIRAWNVLQKFGYCNIRYVEPMC